MTIEQFQAAYNAQPFEPFVIHLADGGKVVVKSKDFFVRPPGGRTVAIWQPDGSESTIDLLLVTRLVTKPGDEVTPMRPSS